MNINVKKSFGSPFSDEKWYLKLILPFIVTASGLINQHQFHMPKEIILITMAIMFIPSIIVSGFYLQFQHNEINDELPLLPDFNNKIKSYLIFGLKTVGIVLIYLLFFLLLVSICTIGLKTGPIGAIVSAILFFTGVIFLIMMLSFAQSSFADNFCFKDSLKFGRIFGLISKAKTEIIIYMLFSLAFILIVSTLNVLMKITAFVCIAYPFFILFLQLILNNLIAQVYKVAKFRLENPE